MVLDLFKRILITGVLAPAVALADPAPFDLTGPAIHVEVTHSGETLPISQVPNLSPGDQLSIRADMPTAQSVHYLLVVAFLRGATNPPPVDWFYRAETWTRKGHDGVKIVVPQEAQQVIVFLAPQTGGDYRTLVDAVRGRPGAFVRASQDLNQASLDRSRLDVFLAEVRKLDATNPERLKTVSPLLARSLTIKIDTDCFQKMPELQAPCLTQGQNTLVLSDGHSTSIVEALTGGPSSDLALQISASPIARFGYYSPYVAAAFDMARILDSFRSAQFQYIPALPQAQGDHLELLLNSPPSFHPPLSVLVTALPAVAAPQAPPLEPVDPKQLFCAERNDLVLPVEGAPLVYSTGYAHDMKLQVKTSNGRTVELPVHADVEKGGFIADTTGLSGSEFGSAVDAELHGLWGFQPFTGPTFRLDTSRTGSWRLTESDAADVIVGRDDTIKLHGDPVACVQDVTLDVGDGASRALDWQAAGPHQLSLKLPLTDRQPGPLTILVRQYGMKDVDKINFKAYAQAAKLDSLTVHAGDLSGKLKGTRLDQVAGLTLDGVVYKPDGFVSSGGQDEMTLSAADPSALSDKLRQGHNLAAKVLLKDGREISLKVAIAAPRPKAILMAKGMQAPPAAGPVSLKLDSPDDLPPGTDLTFSVQAQPPTRFDGKTTVEVATADGSASVKLTVGAGLTLEDPTVALASLILGKALGPSAFGPLRFRVVEDGVEGDWQPLANLVRLPNLQGVHCSNAATQPCELLGSDLFLISAVADNPQFRNEVLVPEGFPGDALAMPPPHAGRLYLKLHDDPSAVGEATLPN